MIKQWDENQNKGWINQLHLVWFDHITSNLSIHPCCLESPSGTLGKKKNDVVMKCFLLHFTIFCCNYAQILSHFLPEFFSLLCWIVLFFYWLKKLQSVVKWFDKKGTLLFLSQAEFQVPLISFELMKKIHSPLIIRKCNQNC